MQNIQVFMVSLILLILSSTCFSKVIELAYDDGSHSFPISYRFNAQRMLAVRFTPPTDSVQIL